MKKIIASILVVLLFLVQLLRYNLWIINLSTDISIFDLLDGVCWILAIILLLLNQTTRFIISVYILLGLGAINVSYNEITKTAESYDPNNYIFLEIGIICIIGYNILISYLARNKKN